jgi:PAS domain S-box-containing protein
MPKNTALATRIVEESTLDAVIVADRSGQVTLWNAAAEDMFGYPESEALGQSLDLIIPEKLRGRHWAGWDRVMDTGVTNYGTEPLTAPGITRDGQRLSLEFSIVLLKDADGAVEGVGAVLRDVTARWEAERELRRRVRELEAPSRG